MAVERRLSGTPIVSHAPCECVASELVVVGECPMAENAVGCYFSAVNPLLLIIVLLLLFGGGGFYIGGPAYGGGGVGLILVICLIVYLVGGFGRKG